MTPCLTPAELLRSHLFASATPEAEHLRDCGRCGARLDALRARLLARRPRDIAHLDDFALAEMLDAESDSQIAADRLAHLVGCGECRDAFAALVVLVRDPAVREELDRRGWLSRDAGAATRWRRPARIAAGALAAAAVVLFAVTAVATRNSSVAAPILFRHATIDVAAAPRLVSPIGTVPHVDTLTWTAVPRADRYQVTVFDRNGETAWEGEAADTFAAVPSAVVPRSSGPYRWRVKARISFDRWVDSEFGEFTVTGGDR